MQGSKICVVLWQISSEYFYCSNVSYHDVIYALWWWQFTKLDLDQNGHVQVGICELSLMVINRRNTESMMLWCYRQGLIKEATYLQLVFQVWGWAQSLSGNISDTGRRMIQYFTWLHGGWQDGMYAWKQSQINFWCVLRSIMSEKVVCVLIQGAPITRGWLRFYMFSWQFLSQTEAVITLSVWNGLHHLNMFNLLLYLCSFLLYHVNVV